MARLGAHVSTDAETAQETSPRQSSAAVQAGAAELAARRWDRFLLDPRYRRRVASAERARSNGATTPTRDACGAAVAGRLSERVLLDSLFRRRE